jgi:3-oxoacyl-[acyl-carrier-protein] synthase-1
MSEVYIASDNIISSLGNTTAENFLNCRNSRSGITLTSDKKLTQSPLPASLIDWKRIEDDFDRLACKEPFTRIEKLFVLSISDALKATNVDIKGNKTLLIISTTKGNIELLEAAHPPADPDRMMLWDTAARIQRYFQMTNEAVVISHACISGLSAIILGARLIRSGQYENIIVSGADLLTEFIISGFQSFKAISPNPCKPFDAARDGITLGEGCGTVVLTSDKTQVIENRAIKILGVATSNDANHISGPSRTGDGLNYAISGALKEAGISNMDEIGFISAHGTATSFNDEMEAKAFKMAGLEKVPVNSLKGFFGHTLGAAGIIESIISIHGLLNNLLIPTIGFEKHGVSENINIIARIAEKRSDNCLKTASGFGGCNAAVLYSK